MTRKDYILIAAAIACVDDYDARQEAASYLAINLAKDNPRFDRVRFLEACGVQS